MNAKEVFFGSIRVCRVLIRKFRNWLNDGPELPPQLKMAQACTGILVGLAITQFFTLFLSIALGDYWMIPFHLSVMIAAPILYVRTEERTKKYLDQNKD